MDREEMLDFVRNYRGIKYKVCEKCSGWGIILYSSTSKWRGGIGGQAMTTGECNKCWGSGDSSNPWLNLKLLDSILTKEQKKLLKERLEENESRSSKKVER